MNRFLCDQTDEIVTHLISKNNNEHLQLPEYLAEHIRHCSYCSEIPAIKTAVLRLVNSIKLDPLHERRLQVKILSRTHTVKPRKSFWVPAVLSASSVVFVMVLFVSIVFNPLVSPTTMNVSVSEMLAADIVLEDSNYPIIETKEEDDKITLSRNSLVWMKKNTFLHIVADSDNLVRVNLRNGMVIVSIADHPVGFRFIVETPSAEVEALGTVFSVEVSSNGVETVRVAESSVKVSSKNSSQVAVVNQGEQLELSLSSAFAANESDILRDLEKVRGDLTASVSSSEKALVDIEEAERLTNTKKNRPLVSEARSERVESFFDRVSIQIDNGQLDSAERMLKQPSRFEDERLRLLFKLAGAYRDEQNYQKAVIIYQTITKIYPERESSINAMVSIAQIKHGFLKDPAGAVYYYDEYLKRRPHGILAEASFAGKIRALYSLKQWRDVAELSDLYFNFFPKGLSKAEIVQKQNRAKEYLNKIAN